MKFNELVILAGICLLSVEVVQAEVVQAERVSPAISQYEFNKRIAESQKRCIAEMNADPSVVRIVTCQKADPEKGAVNGYVAMITFADGEIVDSIDVFTKEGDVSKYIHVIQCANEKSELDYSCKPQQGKPQHLQTYYLHNSWTQYITRFNVPILDEGF